MVEVYIDGFRTRGYGIFNIFKKGGSRFANATPIDVLCFREANDKEKYIKNIVDSNTNGLYNIVEISSKHRTYIANRSVYTYNRMENVKSELAHVLELLSKEVDEKLILHAYSLGGLVAMVTITEKIMHNRVSKLHMYSAPIHFTGYSGTPVYQIIARIFMRAGGDTYIKDLLSRKFYKRLEKSGNEMIKVNDVKVDMLTAKFTKRVKFIASLFIISPIILWIMQPWFNDWIINGGFITFPIGILLGSIAVHLMVSDGMVADKSQSSSNLDGIKIEKVYKKKGTAKSFGSNLKGHAIMTGFPHNLSFYQINTKERGGDE